LTNNFDRKTIGLDRAYITYSPVAHKWLSLTGGKFAYQWQRTQITGDPDLNPEGFNEKLSFDIHQIPVVQNLTVQGMQLTFNEVSGTGGLYHGHDSFAVGGQVSSKLAFKIWTATPSFMILNWRYADAILNSSAFHDSFRRQHWSASCSWRRSRVFESVDYRRRNRFSNCPDQRAESQRVRIFAERYDQLHPVDLSNPTAPRWHFLSSFLYADFVLNNQFKTPSARFPVNLLLEYENNLNASDHPFTTSARSGCVSDGGTPPVITCTTSQPLVNTNLGRQSHAYLADISIGQQKGKGDIQVGYAWLRQEQDPAIASFAESDQRAPTNILQHRIYGLWKLRANTVASFTWWHGRTLNSNLLNSSLPAGVTAGQVEPWLNRLQFDLIYAF